MSVVDGPSPGTPRSRHRGALARRASVLGSLLAAIYLVGDLAPSADAHPRVPTPDENRWSEPGQGPALLARRRRRRPTKRTPPVRRHRPVRKAAPPASTADVDPGEAPAPSASGGESPSPAGLQRGARVEFDGRLVHGQTAQSGAIYLFARKRSELRSMVKERSNYRREILRTVYPEFGAR